MNPEPQNNSPENFSDNAALFHRLKTRHVAGLIVILLFALYPGVILCTHSFFFRDYGLFTYPVAYFEHESFWRGEVPLWNPLNECGVPFLAQWNTSACYPPSLIYMLLPLPQSLNYFLLGHLVLAGVGMFWLARRWTENNLAAAVGGIAFALNGLTLNCLAWTSNLAALSWEPLVILCVEQAWQNRHRKKIICAALAGAMQMLSGAPEIIIFTWTILAVLWLGQILQKQISFFPALKAIAAVILLVTALSAIQLLPFFDLLEHSERNSSFTQAGGFPMPVWGWANLVAPIFHCVPYIFGAWLQPHQAWTSSYYVGLATLALALVAIWRPQQQRLVCYLLAVSAFGGLVLALGDKGILYGWLQKIFPWINFARYPIKFVALPVFAIPLLAAFGIEQLQTSETGNSKRHPTRLIVAGILLLLIMTILLVIARWWLPPEFPWRPVWRDGAMRAIFLVAIVAAVITINRAISPSLRRLIIFGIPILIAFDLATTVSVQDPVVVTKAFGPLELNMTSRPSPGESRAMLSRIVSAGLLYAGTTNELYYYAGLRGALFENCNIPENIPKVDGFSSLHLKEQWDIENFFYFDQSHTDLLPPGPLLDFLGVSQISSTNVFVWNERKSFMPLVTAGQKPIFKNPPEILKSITSENFSPRETVYLPPEAEGKISATNLTPTKISDESISAQQIEFKITASAAAMVVIAQSFYHNWHAYIDNRPVQLWRANHAFQALEVPAGNHHVELRYEDWMFRIGAIISAVALTGCLAGLFLGRSTKK